MHTLSNMVKFLLDSHEELVKRFLLLSLVQTSGEASLDDIDELQKLRKKLYKLTRDDKTKRNKT